MKYTSRIVDEKNLLQLISEGDRPSYAILYTHYYPLLYRFIYFICQSQEDTEEIIQEVLLKIWEKRAVLITIASFEDYLFRMAKNKLVDMTRRQATKLKMVQQVARQLPEADDRTEKDLIYSLYYKTAITAIEQLPARKKAIFLMSAQEEMTLDEIARALNISRSAVKKQLYAAIRFIKEQLKDHAEWATVVVLCYCQYLR
ncbi:RNA polymerase sigma-70 factor (ECF subfamily) [Chitinophaga niastensis]|uniref:RNA polymerase sigma-70 factor (ECF subfamily) n=1 Tax=Chitinophaga niastensis TaxID=536980 RepID=A0A2P8HKF3_CHINA|nr:sigma-70 family RNA polymerase sigma factor [Chitinophaga niastensis]PSL46699.1 RNA polymerase sigma-70 factor (ECF subfamily) [Chitinophaga niastensis]